MSTVLSDHSFPSSGVGESARSSLPPAAASAPPVPVELPTPLERLKLSRARLHAAMFPPAPPAKPKPAGMVEGWLASLKALPGVDLVIDTLDAWWSHHPLRPMADVAGQTSRVAIKPIAKEHPYALIAVAAVAGMLIAGLRPWRWALRSALFAGLLPQILSKTVSKLPIESWMTMLGGALARSPARPPAAPQDAVAPNGMSAMPPRAAPAERVVN